MNAADHISALRTWAALGSGLQRAPPTWGPAEKLIRAAEQSVKEDTNRLKTLLKQSEAIFHPLDDPFSVDLGLHRWLEGGREEAYSDWLAWVAGQATPDELFLLFGLEPVPGIGSKPLIDRERPVSNGHDGHAGRLDIVVEFDQAALVVVEIKMADAEHADVLKHGGYKRWIKRQPHQHKRAVLIVTAGDREEYEGFRTVEWANVCVHARCLAARLCGEKNYTTAAIVLGFIAAVEQNLVGFSAERIQAIRKGKTGLFNPAVVDHLQRFSDEWKGTDG